MDDTVVADPRARADDGVGIHDGPRADRRAGAHRDERPDRDVRPYRGIARDRRQAIHALRGRRGLARRAPRRARTPSTDRRSGARRTARRRGPSRGAEDDRRGLRRGHLAEIPRVRDERQVARLRLLEAGDADDLDVAIAFETAPEAIGNLAKPQGLIFCGGRGPAALQHGPAGLLPGAHDQPGGRRDRLAEALLENRTHLW